MKIVNDYFTDRQRERGRETEVIRDGIVNPNNSTTLTRTDDLSLIFKWCNVENGFYRTMPVPRSFNTTPFFYHFICREDKMTTVQKTIVLGRFGRNLGTDEYSEKMSILNYLRVTVNLLVLSHCQFSYLGSSGCLTQI